MARTHCPHCGTANQDVAENAPCWKCGKALNAPVDPNAPPLPKPTVDPSNYLLKPVLKEAKSRRKNTPLVAFVLLIIVVIIVVVVSRLGK